MTRGALATKYSLKEDIPENVVVRDQMSTWECWAFAGIAVLESNLALRDKLEGRGVSVYDYSERHMDYSSAINFSDGINEYGYREDITLGGWWETAQMYLTNGKGAILEKDMPFENNQNIISLSEIQNKEVQTKVEDTVYFEPPPTKDTTSTQFKQWQQVIKQHIIKYGGISAYLDLSDQYDSPISGSYCYKEAEYTNHSVTIIGWDDEYSIENFNENSRPTNPGAWIVKNSWGDGIYGYTVSEWKQYVFEIFPDEFAKKDWDKPEDMPDSFAISQLESNGFTYNENKKKYCKEYYKYEGYWYISYEDGLINECLNGIETAKVDLDYNNLYQHDIFGGTDSSYINKSGINGNEKKAYLANVFEKKTDTVEQLNEVSIMTNQSYNCKVYVNPNGTSKSKEDLQEVELEEGDYETINAGYHTLKFAHPVDIIGENFVVVVEVETAYSTESNIIVSLESNTYPVYTAVANPGESYLTYGENFQNNSWIDVSDEFDSNLCIKAFTTNGIEEIEVTTNPNKTQYIEGEDFNPTGMVVMQIIKGQREEITDYTIENGEDLKLGQESIVINYKGKTVEVPIKVVEKTLSSIAIKTLPTKEKYYLGEILSTDGLSITITYNNGSTKEIQSGYTCTPSTLNNVGTEEITVSYGGKTTTFSVIVQAVEIQKIQVKDNQSTIYNVGDEVNNIILIVTYNNGKVEEITKGYTCNPSVITIAGNQDIEISYGGKTTNLTINAIEQLKIEISENYEIEEENNIKYISGIQSYTKISQIQDIIKTNGIVKVYNKAKEIIDSNENIATGMIVRVILNDEEEEYNLVVIGDLSGDGIMGNADLLKLVRFRANLDLNLEGAYLRATDIYIDGIYGDNKDILRMARLLVNLEEY